MLFYHWTVVVKPAVQITQDDFYGVPLRFYWLMNEIHPTSFFFLTAVEFIYVAICAHSK